MNYKEYRRKYTRRMFAAIFVFSAALCLLAVTDVSTRRSSLLWVLGYSAIYLPAVGVAVESYERRGRKEFDRRKG